MQSELSLQSKCYQWFHNKYPEYRGLLFHVNNKAKNSIEGNKFKAIGVVAGIPDLLFVFGGKLHPIEMKTEQGTVSADQKEIHEKWKLQGITPVVCRSFEQFQEIIISIIEQKQHSFVLFTVLFSVINIVPVVAPLAKSF